MLKTLLFYLKVSRPGLWFATIWLYLLPTSRSLELLESPAFWFGLLYVCFPINFLVYGWNDVVDHETDALNPVNGFKHFRSHGHIVFLHFAFPIHLRGFVEQPAAHNFAKEYLVVNASKAGIIVS